MASAVARELTDEEVFGAQPGIAQLVTQEAIRQGVDPQLALSVARTESNLRPGAVSPKGAIGPMQLMPGTAADLGVDPNDPSQNVQGGVAYLKQQLQRFGDPRLAAAAYNAGPGAVQKYGGVPPYAETQAYVDKVAAGAPSSQQELSDAEVFGQTPPTAPRDGAITAQVGGLESGPGWSAPVAYHGPPAVVQEAADGFTAPFKAFGHDVAEGYRRRVADATAPPATVGDATQRAVSGLMDYPRVAADALGLTSAPLQAAIHPLAGAISRALPPKATHTEWHGIIPHTYVDGDMSPEQGRATVENGINTALQGARAPGVDLATARLASAVQGSVPGANLTQQVRAVAPMMPVPTPRIVPSTADIVSGLKGEKQALYAKVDGSGFTFPGADVSGLAAKLDAEIRAKGGPKAAKASPQADSVVGRIKALAGQKGGVTLSQLDEVRSDIWPLLMENGGSDAVYGSILRSGIDDLINGAKAPFIGEARAANTRWMKADEVSRRVRSAELQAGRANSGENLANAIRQKLSPMIDPMHSGHAHNLTPDEAASLERIVVGDKTQNALRTWGNRLRNPLWTGAATTPATLLGLAGGGPIGGATAAGLTAAGMQAAGQALRAAAEKRTMTNVDRLVRAIAGVKPAAAAPRLTPASALGAAVISAPLVRRPDQSERKVPSK